MMLPKRKGSNEWERIIESKENVYFDSAKKKLQKVKNWYRMIPVYLIGSFLVFGMIYFMREQQFPEFMIYMFMAFPLIFWFFFLVQGFLVLGRKPGFLKNWEEREIRRLMEAEDQEEIRFK